MDAVGQLRQENAALRSRCKELQQMLSECRQEGQQVNPVNILLFDELLRQSRQLREARDRITDLEMSKTPSKNARAALLAKDAELSERDETIVTLAKFIADTLCKDSEAPGDESACAEGAEGAVDSTAILREVVKTLEGLLRERVGQCNKQSARVHALVSQMEDAGMTPRSDAKMNADIEAQCDTSDLAVVIDCKEAELRILHYRLEQQTVQLEKATQRIRDLELFVNSLRKLLLEQHISPPQSSSGEDDWDTEHVTGLLHLIKSLRKQNSVLHTMLCEKGAKLRHYAVLLADKELLAETTQAMSGIGDVGEQLRLAFAERDEEIFLKDQALMNLSTEILVLEESLDKLYSQLLEHGIEPARPMTCFSKGAMESRAETQREVIERQRSRAKLEETQTQLTLEIKDIENVLNATAGLPSDSNTIDLCARREKLLCERQIVDAQCAAYDEEVGLLRQVLAQSTRMVIDLQSRRDIDASVSVMDKIKRKFFNT